MVINCHNAWIMAGKLCLRANSAVRSGRTPGTLSACSSHSKLPCPHAVLWLRCKFAVTAPNPLQHWRCRALGPLHIHVSGVGAPALLPLALGLHSPGVVDVLHSLNACGLAGLLGAFSYG